MPEDPDVPATAGARAENALLTLLGDHRLQLDALADLLITKGVITEAEWDETVAHVYVRDDAVAPAEWARRCLDPADGAALDAFFGG